eukprot:7144363-Ditylum_brightwellii.AAC.1
MQKADGARVVTDEENAQVFCEHFSKIFNNQNPLLCNHTALSLIPQPAKLTHLVELPSLSKVHADLCRMANGNTLGSLGVTSDALNSMV